MKTNIKKLAAPVVGLAVLAAGIVSAAATDPIPNPLPNAVAGNVIKASDINDLATAVGILDARTGGLQSNGSQLKIGDGGFINAFNISSDGAAPILSMQDSDSEGVNANPYAAFYDSLGDRLGYVGYGSAATENLYLTNDMPNGSTIIRSAAGDRIIVGSNGNVGIGTSSPQASLHVNGSVWNQGDTILNGGRVDGRMLVAATSNPEGSTDRRSFFAPRLLDDSGWDWNREFGFNSYYRSWYFEGSFGIDTKNPTSKLQVVGLPEYADNTEATAGGLTVGAFYHTAGNLKVVY